MEINRKLMELSEEDLGRYQEILRDIFEFRSECFSYGAKNPVTLPSEDRKRIKENLYQRMFPTLRTS